MSFAQPQFLWLLLVLLPAMVLFFWWTARERQRLMQQFIQARLLPGLVAGVSSTRQKIRAGILIAAVALLVIALARPQWGFIWQEVTQSGLDIIVAVDTSKSMLAEDIAPNRLARAKLAALDLMQQAQSDRLGLVAFAGSAFLQCPLTIDDTAFRQSVDALDVNTIPDGGTALAEAIDTATRAFKEGDSHKVLVLFTDGEDQDSGAVEAAKRAKDAGVVIFTIGIGSAEGDLLRIKNANGQDDYVRDENGNVVKSHLNESLLQQIAAVAGGFYLPLRAANTVDVLYEKGIAPLPKSDAQEKVVRQKEERYHWPLGLAMILLVVEMLFPERKKSKAKNIKPKAALAVIALLSVLALPSAMDASPASALQEYQSGNFTNALQEFSRLSEIQTNDLRLVFNAGAAAYRATNFDAAQKLFAQVTLSPDLKLQQAAFYNLGNTQYRLGEQKFEPSEDSLDNVETAWKEAAQSYANAGHLNTNDVDAAYNLNFTKQQIGLIAALRGAMRHAKQQADDAVRRNEYHHALEILQSLNNPIANKKFQDYVKKLKDIDEIVTPSQR